MISKFREAEIEHLAISASEKEELKSGWRQWLEATTRGIKDELRGEGKLGWGLRGKNNHCIEVVGVFDELIILA